MSNGSRERECPQDVQCSHCGRFYRNDGIHGHEPNCPLRGEDVVIVPIRNGAEASDPLGDDIEGAGTPPTEPADGEAPRGPTPGDVDDVQEASADDGARADGGRVRDPPTPSGPAPATSSSPATASDGDPTEDVPDHLVDADDFLSAAEQKNPHLARTDEWRQIREAAERHDYVDLRKTDLEAGKVELV